MTPILFEYNATSFTTNGIARLVDAIRCDVSEERNGIYELELDYPVSGRHFEDIQEGRIIVASHDEEGDLQPFDIYASTKPINGVVTFRAHHVSYRNREITVEAFTAGDCGSALTAIKTKSINDNPFTYTTDKMTSATMKVDAPACAMDLLGGSEGSVLDTYGGGEYEFDGFEVKLHASRGRDADLEIRYGKNLVDLEAETDYSDAYNGVVPYWTGSAEDGGSTGEPEEETVTIPEKVIYSGTETYCRRNITVPLDLSGSFSTPPSAASLRAEAQKYLPSAHLPDRSIEVDFVQLAKTEEYKDYVAMQTVKLCDTVAVIYPEYDISVRQKVVKTEWDALKERYKSLTLGKPQTNFASVINASQKAEVEKVQKAVNRIKAITDNTNQFFWKTETGTDTGAHITEIPREEFLADPTNGGPNLLARSTGIALRDGLTELARYSSAGIQIGIDSEAHTLYTASALEFYEGSSKTASFGSAGVELFGGGSKVAEFKSNGMKCYESGAIIASIGGTSAQIGKATGDHLEISTDGFSYKNGSSPILSVSTIGVLETALYLNGDRNSVKSRMARIYAGQVDNGTEGQTYRLDMTSIGSATYHPEVRIASETISSGEFFEQAAINLYYRTITLDTNGGSIHLGPNSTYVYSDTSFRVPSAYDLKVTARALYISAAGTLGTTASSRRWKKYIRPLTPGNNEQKRKEMIAGARALEVSVFKYKNGQIADETEEEKNKDYLGLIAEDVAEKMPIAAIPDDKYPGEYADWDIRQIVPAALLLAQEAMLRIDALEESLKA